MPPTRLLAIGLAVTALGLAPAAAAACTTTWDGGGGDLLWSTATNWSADAVPAAADEVCLPALPGGPVLVDLPVTVAGVTASHPVRVATGQSLSAVLRTGTFSLADGASLTGGRIDGATVLVGVGDTATLAGGGFAAGTLGGGGEAAITGAFAWTGGRMRGDGVTSVAPGSTVTIDADLPNGSPQRYGASIEDDRHLQNSGTIVWADGYVGINDQATLHNAGTLSLESTSDSWEANGDTSDAALVNTGLIVKPTGANRVSLPDVDNDGTVRVVRGTIDFASLVQTIDGRVELELGGTVAGTEHGVLRTFFDKRLSGTLALTLSPGYAPADGDVFHVVTGSGFGRRHGTFTTLEGVALPGGRTLVPAYLLRGLDLSVAAAPGPAPGAALAATAVADTGAPPAAEDAGGSPAPLHAADDFYRRRAARRLFFGIRVGPRANDRFPAGTRLRLVSRPRGARVHLDRRTGALRIRLRSRAPRVLRLRYRLIAPDGRRSRVASVTIRLM